MRCKNSIFFETADYWVYSGLRIHFFIWASRRGSGADASKRRKHTFTNQRLETLSPPAAPSGFPLQCFWPSVPVGANNDSPLQSVVRQCFNAENRPKTFPLQSLSRTRPQHHRVSRRIIPPPRPQTFPAPRTPRAAFSLS